MASTSELVKFNVAPMTRTVPELKPEVATAGVRVTLCDIVNALNPFHRGFNGSKSSSDGTRAIMTAITIREASRPKVTYATGFN
jgi:hypothetical protein